MILLTADWHLDDNPDNEYRWNVFDEVQRLQPDDLFILGDLCDRKDRHSGELVNRLVEELKRLRDRGIYTTIIMGNHDRPLKGKPYWHFLNSIDGIRFHSRPRAHTARGGNILWLPHSDNPKEDWDDIRFRLYDVVFMHQPVNGARVGGRELEVNNMPPLPRDRLIYSGDIHTPQTVRGVEYVGAPHWTNFGDDHLCRMLELNNDFTIAQQHFMHHQARKVLVEATSFDDVLQAGVQRGDRVKLRMTLQPDQVEGWPAERDRITNWAKDKGVEIVQLETTVHLNRQQGFVDLSQQPKGLAEILKDFAAHEGLSDAHVTTGLEILTRGMGT